MPKILLIQPMTSDSYWKMSGILKGKYKSLLPPLGLATIAAFTPPGYEVQILDESIEEIDFDTPCDLVGITGFNLHAERMIEISKAFQERGVKTVGGGPFCTSNAEEISSCFDIIVCGEAENIWSKVLEDLQNGNPEKFYHGEQIDMAESPHPRWDLIKLNKYFFSIAQSSRGCPYDCEFCDVVALFGNRMRYKPVDHILQEIKSLEKLRAHSIFIADDNLIGNKKYIFDLLDRLIKFNRTLKRPLRFATQVTLNVAKDEELLDLFKKANFFMFFIGIESPSEESLIETNKKHNLALDMKEAVRRIQSRGIFITNGMIVGFDSDDLSIFSAQKRFLQESGLPVSYTSPLYPIKGTKLWDRLNKEGRLFRERDPLQMGKFNYSFFPKNMTRAELMQEYFDLVEEINSYPFLLKVFRNFFDQVDFEKVKKDSPLTARMRSRRKLFNFQQFLLMVYFFIIAGNKESRSFYFSVINLAIKKGWICLGYAQDVLLQVISNLSFARYALSKKSEVLDQTSLTKEKLASTLISESVANGK